MDSDVESAYEVVIEGSLDLQWSSWFDGLIVTQCDPTITTLTGELDQAALRGVLNKIWDLNLTVVSVRRMS